MARELLRFDFGAVRGCLVTAIRSATAAPSSMKQICRHDPGAIARPTTPAPVIGGLRHVLAGGRFDEAGRCEGGRRLLGWSVGKHWMLEDERA